MRKRDTRGAKPRPAKPATIKQIRKLYPKARRFRGGEKHRYSAEMFAALVWYAHISEGASIKAIADDLGITPSTLHFRLVRYGYKTTTGTSDTYRSLIGNARSKKTYCKRGHPFDEINTRVDPKSKARICRACERKRCAEYQARKREIR